MPTAPTLPTGISPRTSTATQCSSISSGRVSGGSSWSGAAPEETSLSLSVSEMQGARMTLVLSAASSSPAVVSEEFTPTVFQPRPPPPTSVTSEFLCCTLRKMVSQNRRRLRLPGFDLDLSYITDRVVAMGYPADTTEALYRNSMADTVQFLEYYHKDHYKVFNLRGQYVYDTSKFHHRVLSFEMVDHHPPRLEMMAPFCREVHDYLNEDPLNIVAVHCKAGKGRTGVMICAYLVYINFYHNPRQNMDYYSIVRTENNKGVTIPSQRRYVYYFSHLRRFGLNYMPYKVELVGIFLEKPPRATGFLKKGLAIRVVNGDVDVFLGDIIYLTKEEWEEEEDVWANGVISEGEDDWEKGGDVVSRRAYGWRVPATKRVFLEGDVMIEIQQRNVSTAIPLPNEKKKIGHAWFNTMFVCPSYCGGPYQHGDEAYPYPEGATTITRSKHEDFRPKSGSASVPSSPPKGRSAGSMVGRRAPSFDARKTPKLKKFSNIHETIKKYGRGRNHSAVDFESAKREVSAEKYSVAKQTEFDDTRHRTFSKATGATSTSCVEAASDFDMDSSDDDVMLLQPPGLDEHCPKETLQQVYMARGRKPPREGINQMLKEAHKNNLIQDDYNKRRLSVAQEGSPVPMSPAYDSHYSQPFSVRRAPDEHVNVFSVLEIDEAYKNKDIDPGFKMILLTRCIPRSSPDERLADRFLSVTREKQGAKDAKKKEKVEARQKKLISGAASGSQIVDDTADTVCEDRAGPSSDPRYQDPYLRSCPLLATKKETMRKPKKEADKDESPTSSSELRDRSGGVSPKRVESLSDFDVEVRSYHPANVNWLHSQSSASTSTSSSESDLAVMSGQSERQAAVRPAAATSSDAAGSTAASSQQQPSSSVTFS